MASCLAVIALALIAGRWYALDPDLAGRRGAATWKVTLTAAGELTAHDGSVTVMLPPDFRQQHIADERFQSKELLHRVAKLRTSGRREVVWRPANLGGLQPFRLSCSFRCVVPVRQPTPAMKRVTREMDGPPTEGAELKPGPNIESYHKDIFQQARELVQDDQAPIDQVRAFFEFVRRLEHEPTLGSRSALECLRQGGGDSHSKSRLLVALCRNRGIPARLLGGLILVGDQEQGLHYWAEAWVNDHWLPLCPTYQHFGTRRFPKNYLVLQVGDDDLVRSPGGRCQYGFVVHDLHDPFGLGEDQSPPGLRNIWLTLSLYTLQPAEQHLVKFLLLVPVAALIVSFCRTVIGVSTFGTFAPALLGLAFLDLKALPWGLAIFLSTVLVGWGMRRLLDRYHLLQVSRVSVLLTLIVGFLVLVIVAANRYDVAATQYISLFPLVILTHLVERFWTVESEDGTAASFRTLLGTLGVAVAVSLALSPDAVTSWLFHYPETLGLVLAGQFLLGRYTGYRLTELYRFRDLVQEEPDKETRRQGDKETGREGDKETQGMGTPLAAGPGTSKG
jgi:hypothetical protein